MLSGMVAESEHESGRVRKKSVREKKKNRKNRIGYKSYFTSFSSFSLPEGKVSR